MDVRVGWWDERDVIIHSHFNDTISWEDFDRVVDQVMALANSVTYPIAIVTSFGENFGSPRGNAFPHFRRFLRLLPEHVEYVVTVQPASLERTLISLFVKMHPRARKLAQFVDNFDAVEQIADDLYSAIT